MKLALAFLAGVVTAAAMVLVALLRAELAERAEPTWKGIDLDSSPETEP